MNILKIVLTSLQVLGALFLIVTILLQSSKRAGLSGTISGVADSFFSKNKAKTFEAILAKVTVVVSILFVIITLALNMI